MSAKDCKRPKVHIEYDNFILKELDRYLTATLSKIVLQNVPFIHQCLSNVETKYVSDYHYDANMEECNDKAKHNQKKSYYCKCCSMSFVDCDTFNCNCNIKICLYCKELYCVQCRRKCFLYMKEEMCFMECLITCSLCNTAVCGDCHNECEDCSSIVCLNCQHLCTAAVSNMKIV